MNFKILNKTAIYSLVPNVMFSSGKILFETHENTVLSHSLVKTQHEIKVIESVRRTNGFYLDLFCVVFC